MTRKNPERPQELLAAAQQLFFTKGYENTSVNDIIQAVGVSKGAFYHHFDSKTAVLEAMVDALISQELALQQEIIADETLSAIPKWVQAFQVSVNWKTPRKDEMMAVFGLIKRKENIHLQHEIRNTMQQKVAPEFAKIILQGVAEGVFAVAQAEETAVLILALIEHFSTALGDLVLNPEAYENPIEVAQRILVATQTAVERVLQAPAGSLPIMEPETISAWFE
jgi:AcrR family transcriptional regulator